MEWRLSLPTTRPYIAVACRVLVRWESWDLSLVFKIPNLYRVDLGSIFLWISHLNYPLYSSFLVGGDQCRCKMMGISQNKACMVKVPILPKEAQHQDRKRWIWEKVVQFSGRQTKWYTGKTAGTSFGASRYLALGEAEGAKEDFRKLLVPSPYQAVLKASSTTK